MAFPKITFLDKIRGIGVPKEQNLITVDNINEIKHVVNSLSDSLSDSLSGVGAYKAGHLIEITDDRTINVTLPKTNLELSGRYIVCHRNV